MTPGGHAETLPAGKPPSSIHLNCVSARQPRLLAVSWAGGVSPGCLLPGADWGSGGGLDQGAKRASCPRQSAWMVSTCLIPAVLASFSYCRNPRGRAREILLPALLLPASLRSPSYICSLVSFRYRCPCQCKPEPAMDMKGTHDLPNGQPGKGRAGKGPGQEGPQGTGALGLLTDGQLCSGPPKAAGKAPLEAQPTREMRSKRGGRTATYPLWPWQPRRPPARTSQPSSWLSTRSLFQRRPSIF